MKRLALVLCAAWGVALCCCSDDDPVFDPEAAQQALEDCTQTGIFSMLRLVSAIDEIIEVVEGDFPPDGMTVSESTDPGDPAFTWDVEYDLPSSGSGEADTRIAGKITFGEDPTDGVEFGSTTTVSLTVTSLGGPYTGSVDGDVVIVNEDTIEITGDLVLNDSAGGCNVDFTIPATPGLSLSDVGFVAEAQLAANVFGILIEGLVNVSVTTGGNTLVGTLSLDDLSQDATVTNASINDVEIDDFSFEVAPDPETVSALSECLFGSLFTFQFVIDAIGPIAEEIDSPGTYEEITVTEVSTGVYDFVYDTTGGTIIMGISLDGILSGRVTFPISPTSPVSVTWTFEPEGDGASAQSTTPLMVILPEGSEDPGSVYGSGSFTATGELSCSSTFDIPSGDPLELVLDFGLEIGDSGRVTFTSTVGDDTLRLSVELTGTEEIVEASLNGIPIPAELILGIL